MFYLNNFYLSVEKVNIVRIYEFLSILLILWINDGKSWARRSLKVNEAKHGHIYNHRKTCQLIKY